MAANGTITLTSSNFSRGDGVEIKIKYIEENINVSARTSDVRFYDATMEVKGVDAGTYASILLKANGETIIDAKDYRGDFGAFMVPGVPSVINYSGGTWPKTITVKHNDDGTKTIPVTVTGIVVSNSSWQHGWTIPDYSTTIQLETIAVASSFTVSGTTIGSNMTFAISRASSAFTHKLYYKHGSDAYALIAQGVGTSYTWNIPEAVGGKIPSENSGTFTIKVETYSGGTLLGDATKTVTLTVPNYSLTGSGWYSAGYTNSGTAASGIAKAVKGYSKLTYSAIKSGVSTRYGATLNDPTVAVNGAAIPSGQTLTETSTVVTFRISDSRGKTLSATVTVAALDYAAPSLLNTAAKRCDAGGDEDDEGMFWYARATASVSSLEGANSYTLTAAIRPAGGSYGAENALTSGVKSVFGGTLSATASYTVRIRITDALGNMAQTEVQIPTSAVTFNARPGGNGFAFGKYAETANLLDVDWDARVRGGLTVDGENGNVFLRKTFSVPAGSYVTLAQDSSEHFYIVAGSGWANAGRCAYMLVGYASGASRKAVVNLLPSATQVTITANDDATYRISNTSSVSVTCGVIALVGRLPTIS